MLNRPNHPTVFVKRPTLDAKPLTASQVVQDYHARGVRLFGRSLPDTLDVVNQVVAVRMRHARVVHGPKS